MSTRHTEEKGVALITSLIVMMMIAITSAALIVATTTQYRIGRRSRLEKIAINLAEAGVDYGIWKLNLTNGSSPVSYSGTLGEGRFVASIETVSPPNGRLLTSMGYTKNDEYSRTIKVRIEMAVAIDPYNFAAFGSDKTDAMELTGSGLIDSYNSNTGTTPLLGNGDIGSNADISISGSANVNGDALVVQGNTVTGTVNGSITVTDTYASLPDIPNFTATSPLTSDVTLDTGTYYYTYVDLTAKEVKLNGPVEIYVKQYVTIKGNSKVNVDNNNPNKDATRCMFYVRGEGGQAIDIGQTGVPIVVASFYAPNSSLTLRGNVTLFGNVIAKTLDMKGSAVIYFDEKIKEKQKPIWWAAGATYCRVITSWQRF